MDSDQTKQSRYVKTVDISERALATERARSAKQALESSGDELPAIELPELPEPSRDAVAAAGWSSLTPVQQQAIPYMLEGRDLIVQARTGSGKTGAFMLPMFSLLDPEYRAVQALVLAPTRELARQVNEEFCRMAGDEEYTSFRSALVHGGVRYGPQVSAIKDGAQIVVGTPGRIIDLLEQRKLDLSVLKVLVLDEADEMLSMGFYPAMREIKKYVPDVRQSVMFSATMPVKVQNLARLFLTEPSFLGLSTGDESVDTSEHRYYLVEPMKRDRALVSIMEMDNPDSAIIFANTKKDVEYLTAFLKNYGHDCDGISGDLSQRDRDSVLNRLKSGDLRFLVATDVAARGIDVSDLDYVFMYDVPQNPEYYIHRSGRTARAGKSGTIVVIATQLEHNALKSIAKRYGVTLENRELPTKEMIEEKVSERITVLLEEAYRKKTGVQRERLQRFMTLTEELAEEEPEILAMLVDKFYHESMHGKRDNPVERGSSSNEGSDHKSETSGRKGSGKGGGKRRSR
ncbi:MAG: DEAD/DEAH box helicase [Rhodothermales bacterium]|nr:DEAD/DEAH box helicase [Rhodothermales bacterium]